MNACSHTHIRTYTRIYTYVYVYPLSIHSANPEQYEKLFFRWIASSRGVPFNNDVSCPPQKYSFLFHLQLLHPLSSFSLVSLVSLYVCIRIGEDRNRKKHKGQFQSLARCCYSPPTCKASVAYTSPLLPLFIISSTIHKRVSSHRSYKKRKNTKKKR